MQIKEIYEKVSKMGLYVGDQVIVTNWIHKRLHLEILPSTFKNGRESNVRVVADGSIATVGRDELREWIAQEDTEVIRLGTGEEVKI